MRRCCLFAHLITGFLQCASGVGKGVTFRPDQDDDVIPDCGQKIMQCFAFCVLRSGQVRSGQGVQREQDVPLQYRHRKKFLSCHGENSFQLVIELQFYHRTQHLSGLLPASAVIIRLLCKAFKDYNEAKNGTGGRDKIHLCITATRAIIQRCTYGQGFAPTPR